MADVTSSDGHCTVRLHTNWASALVWTDLTGTITVRRNGVDLATLATGRQIYYDHYFTPLGSPSTYSVTNGTTTSTGATITVPADPQGRTWLKSGVDPNLSLPITQRSIEDQDQGQELGVFPIVGDEMPFVIYGSRQSKRTSATFNAYTLAERDALDRLLDRPGPVYLQPPASTDEKAMWVAVAASKQRWVKAQSPMVAVDHYWTVDLTLIEQGEPVSSALGNIIPGWGWDDVMTYWGTWDAVKAACPTWLYLVQAGVS